MLGKRLVQGTCATLVVLALIMTNVDGAGASRHRNRTAPAGRVSRVPTDFYGVNGNYLYDEWAVRPTHAAAIAATGATIVRREAVWHEIEPLPPENGVHGWVWNAYDGLARDLAAKGLRWQPVLGYST
ncbi:MAG: hypothetical protein QOI10_4084, partial [Solirubrobacterales bacterium]|nr:hypothetical protein [Solirubrobacterales bacterium]